jgi:Ran GTPase-activating protein (RanGAP) involved in mRNA processing and transport
MLLNKYKLSKLHINNNPIGDEGFHKIAVGIQKIETLRIITIANTGISHVSMDSLSKALVNKRFLTKLNLDNCRIGSQGAKMLSEGIRSNETLTNLHVANC